jgi:hypothetical protein
MYSIKNRSWFENKKYSKTRYNISENKIVGTNKNILEKISSKYRKCALIVKIST